VAVMSVVGSPGIATMSASLPFSNVPTLAEIAEEVGVGRSGGAEASMGGIPRSTISLNSFAF